MNINYELKLKRIVIFFSILSFSLLVITAIFEPFTYPIGFMMIGRGRFADFFDTFRAASKYPELGSYCIAPWHYELLKFSNKIFNINTLFIIYNLSICIVIAKIFNTIANVWKKNGNILLFAIFTYPFLFGLWRGNPEILAVLFIFLSILRINDNLGKSLLYYFFAIFIKPNTMFYGIIYILYIRKSMVLFGLTFGLVLFALTISFDSLSEILIASSSCLNSYKINYILGEGGTFLNNSLYGMFKYVIYLFNDDYKIASKIVVEFYDYLISYWIIFYFLTSALALFFLRGALRLYVIYASFILFYPISADYRLVSLGIPLALMMITYNESYKYLIVMILVILLPKHFINNHFTDVHVNITINSLLNPLIIIFSIVYCFIRRKNEGP